MGAGAARQDFVNFLRRESPQRGWRGRLRHLRLPVAAHALLLENSKTGLGSEPSRGWLLWRLRAGSHQPKPKPGRKYANHLALQFDIFIPHCDHGRAEKEERNNVF